MFVMIILKEWKKMNKIFSKLFKEYGKQNWWPISGNYSGGPKTNEEILEVMIGAILTQNTSWNNVEKALQNLDIKNIKNISLEELKEKIRSAGYYNQKAERIKLLINFLEENPIEELKKISTNELRNKLLNLKGIGPETADSILLYAFNRNILVIDTYTKRIFSRMGFLEEEKTYEEWQELFHKNLDPKYFNEMHALIVEHAKKYCKKKPECKKCFFKC